MSHDNIYESICCPRDEPGFVFKKTPPIFEKGRFVDTGDDSANGGEISFQQPDEFILSW